MVTARTVLVQIASCGKYLDNAMRFLFFDKPPTNGASVGFRRCRHVQNSQQNTTISYLHETIKVEINAALSLETTRLASRSRL